MLAGSLKEMPADNIPERYFCFLTQVECDPDVPHYAFHVIGAPVPLVIERYLRTLTWCEHQLQYEEGCALLLLMLVRSEFERVQLCQLPSVVLRTAHATWREVMRVILLFKLFKPLLLDLLGIPEPLDGPLVDLSLRVCHLRVSTVCAHLCTIMCHRI